MKQISIDELGERIEKHGTEIGMKNVEVSGMVTNLDKDGNVKSELSITSLDINQELEKNAT